MPWTWKVYDLGLTIPYFEQVFIAWVFNDRESTLKETMGKKWKQLHQARQEMKVQPEVYMNRVSENYFER